MSDAFNTYTRASSEAANGGVNTFDTVHVFAGVPLTTGEAGVVLPG